MAIYDRWHRDPVDGLKPCACGRGRNRMYPSSVHGQGMRWQVQWEDPRAPKGSRKRPKQNFALRDPAPGEEPDPSRHASAFDALKQREALAVKRGEPVTDPAAGKVTLQAYAEQLRKGRRFTDPEQEADLERRLRLHAYEDPERPGSGLTPTGAPSIGQHSLGLLAQRVSLVSEWADGIALGARRKRRVMGDVSKVMRMAVADGITGRDPVHAEPVTWPGASLKLARAWSPEQARAMRAELPARYRVLVDLGAGTGMRQSEMLGLGVDDVDWLVKEADDPQVRVVRQLKWMKGGKVYLSPVKNRKPHAAPLAAEVRDALSAHLAAFPAVTVTLPWWEPEDKERHLKPVTVRLIVTNADKRPVYQYSLAKTWRVTRRSAGITPDGAREREDGCHALRHTFVSRCLRAGIDPVRVAEFIGDSVKTVVDTYAHFMPGGSNEDARRAIGGFLEEGPCAPDVPGNAAIGT